mmetsp:Transcript_38086/g.121333  ORF Transcript_38086/g.121333 Transcript_38086/m.121333 type:complete len:90 (+) Transcript_38086:607-876(+)
MRLPKLFLKVSLASKKTHPSRTSSKASMKKEGPLFAPGRSHLATRGSSKRRRWEPSIGWQRLPGWSRIRRHVEEQDVAASVRGDSMLTA